MGGTKSGGECGNEGGMDVWTLAPSPHPREPLPNTPWDTCTPPSLPARPAPTIYLSNQHTTKHVHVAQAFGVRAPNRWLKQVCTDAPTHIWRCTPTHMPACTNTHAHMATHAATNAHTLTHMCPYTYTHTANHATECTAPIECMLTIHVWC